MKKYSLALLGCVVLLSGCLDDSDTKKIVPTNDLAVENIAGDDFLETDGLTRKQISALSFIAYAGDKLKGKDSAVNEILQGCVSDELSRQPVLNGRYSLAWGPSVYRFKLAELDDNMMFVANDSKEPGHIVISLRGTNPTAILDWLVEDFYVTKTEAWNYSNPHNSSIRISKATSIGLTALQSLKGRVNVLPPSEVTLKEYLTRRSVNDGLHKITVTGHSLAGALAPALALWLKDTESSWSKASSGIEIHVLPIAGATPGNAEFAAYYDTRLGANTDRLHNPFDVVPQAWYLPTMHEIDNLYVKDGYKIKPSLPERLAFELGVELAKNKDYRQINQSQPALPGVINPSEKSFAAQAGWQHHCGYYNALGMTRDIYQVNSYCVTRDYCEDNPTDSKCISLNQYLCNAVPVAK